MRVTVLVHESDKLKADKFVTGTIDDKNLTKEQFVSMFNGMLGKFSGIIASQIPDAETSKAPTKKAEAKKAKKNGTGRAKA